MWLIVLQCGDLDRCWRRASAGRRIRGISMMSLLLGLACLTVGAAELYLARGSSQTARTPTCLRTVLPHQRPGNPVPGAPEDQLVARALLPDRQEPTRAGRRLPLPAGLRTVAAGVPRRGHLPGAAADPQRQRAGVHPD